MVYVIGKIHTRIMKASLERACPDERPTDSMAALMRAAMTGRTAAVLTLLDRGADVNGRDQNGRTPLMEAAFGGHVETIKTLIERGVDLNAKDNDGWTALMEATSKSHVEAVRVLIAHGSDVSATSGGGWTALKATPRGNAEIARLLKRAGATR